MSVIARSPPTPAGLARWDRGQDRRLEFGGGDAAALNGGSLRHSRIALSVATALDTRLDFSRFEVVRGDAKVMANGNLRYPDVVVFRQTEDMCTDVASSPVVVVEVLSRSTHRVDQYDKNVDYAATRSIQHYVMLSQARRYAVVCSRTPEGWRASEENQALRLTALGVELPFEEIYRRITFHDDAFF